MNLELTHSKRLAIIQSCYIPWRGFFDLISRCDEYVIYDQSAYSSGHWHNRNKLKTASGLQWLTIPVLNVRLGQPIEQVEVDTRWAAAHWRMIEQSYSRAPYFPAEAPALKELYDVAGKEKYLSGINEIFISALMQRLDIKTKITRDRYLNARGTKSDRVLSVCQAVSATHYLSGPSAKTYMELQIFKEAGIEVEWMNYDGYSEYPQLHGEFAGTVSIIDLLFNCGPDSINLFKAAGAVKSESDDLMSELKD